MCFRLIVSPQDMFVFLKWFLWTNQWTPWVSSCTVFFFHINQIFKTNWINFTADVSQNREMEGTAAAQRRAPQRLALRDRHSPIANLLGLYPGVWAKIVFFPINMNMDHYRIRWATLVIFCLMVLIHINLQCFIHGHGSIAIGPIASGYITVCYG